MNVEVHSLASGSSGNAMLIMADKQALLVDAGLSARVLTKGLQQRGIGPGGLSAILLTHEHEDHLRGAPILSSRLGTPVVANRMTLQAAADRVVLPRTHEMTTGDQAAFGPFIVRSFRISHDAVEPVGYVIEVDGVRITYATDLGCPCVELRDAMRGANLCIIEANHDPDWLLRGPYPPAMKARVGSDLGHLANETAADLITERLVRDGPMTFWLAHLSAVNNSPAFARRFVSDRVRQSTSVPCSIEVALRDRPSVVWRRRAFQLCLL